jgi:hypothetical protein
MRRMWRRLQELDRIAGAAPDSADMDRSADAGESHADDPARPRRTGAATAGHGSTEHHFLPALRSPIRAPADASSGAGRRSGAATAPASTALRRAQQHQRGGGGGSGVPDSLRVAAPQGPFAALPDPKTAAKGGATSPLTRPGGGRGAVKRSCSDGKAEAGRAKTCEGEFPPPFFRDHFGVRGLVKPLQPAKAGFDAPVALQQRLPQRTLSRQPTHEQQESDDAPSLMSLSQQHVPHSPAC